MNGKLAALLLAVWFYIVFAALPLTICIAAPDQQTVRVGWFTTDGGQFIDDKGNRRGYSYEYYQEIAKYTGWQYQYIPGSWQECLSRLENGEIDMMSFAQHTEERAQIYDFASPDMGKNYSLLTTLANNTLLTQNDFASFDGKIIGTLKGATQIAQLRKFSEENNFNYIEQNYESLDKLLLALKNKEIDMMLHHSVRRLEPEEKIIAKFAPQPFHFIVKKGNQELLNQLNQVLSEIEINNPYFNQRLSDKYYASNINKGFILTQREKDLLQALPVLRIVGVPGCKPLSYSENDTFKGISADILDKITNILGIKYQFIKTGSYEESLNLLKNGQADLICAYYSDYSWAEQNKIIISSPFIELQYNSISRREVLPQKPTIAAAKGLKFNEDYVLQNYFTEQITWYDTIQECFDAVKDGKQDITFASTYVTESFLQDYRYGNLVATSIPHSHYISFATSGEQALLLNGIIDKALNNISRDEIKNIIAKHTVFQPQKTDFNALLHRHPVESFMALAGLASLMALFLAVIIRAKSRHNQEIKTMLYTDEVTKFPNYRKFGIDAKKILTANNTGHYVFLYVDIQNFKYINDTLGHQQGDLILCKVTEKIHSLMAGDDICARIYADHFAVLLKCTDDAHFTNHINAFISASDSLSARLYANYKIIFKIGIYFLPPNENDIEKVADLANYAKDTIGYVSETTYVYYDTKMRVHVQEEKELEACMNTALENREFEAYFQPRVNIYSKEIVGAEALVRWNHPQKGFLLPGQFIPFFEKNGFVTKLDLYMFEEACKRLRYLLDNGERAVPISTNFSRHHLNNAALPDILLEITKRYRIPTHMLEIEITETVATYNFELAVEMATKLQKYGFLIAIDDFCSGYSSVQLLYKLPLNILKIDKDYTQNKIHNKIESQIISAIIKIAHDNGIDVIFEGVEEQAQEDLIKEHQCRFSQGYFYAKPLRFEDFRKMLHSLIPPKQ